MRRLINRMIAPVGYELKHKLPPTVVVPPAPVENDRATMSGGLQLLIEQEIPVATVLDVGASDGRWSQQCMGWYGKADYVLFEPQPAHTAALAEFKAHSKQSVTIVPAAVGVSEGRIEFDASDAFGGALSPEKTAISIEVDLTTIDATVARLQLEGPFLLKLDTHGYEKSILDGAAQTLEKCGALIIEAYNHRFTAEGMMFWELCAFLAARGFRVIDMVDVTRRPRDHSMFQMDIVFVRDTWKGFKCNHY